MNEQQIGEALTWDDLANYYDEHHGGRKARTLPMDQVFDWCERQTDVFRVAPEGTIHFILKEKETE